MKIANFCDRPDVDEPKLKCGYLIPCPHHTVITTHGKAMKRLLKALGKTLLVSIVGIIIATGIVWAINSSIIFLFIIFALVLSGVFYIFWEESRE